MFRIPRDHPWPPRLDFRSMREVLQYMKQDAERLPGLDGVSKALTSVLQEIDLAECRLTPPNVSPLAARFLPQRH